MGLEIYYKPGVGKRLRRIDDDAAEAAVKAGTHVRVGGLVQEIDPPATTGDDEPPPVKHTKPVEDKPKKAKPKKAP